MPRVHKSVVKNNSNMAIVHIQICSQSTCITTKEQSYIPYSKKHINRFVRITEEIYGTLVQYSLDDEKMVSEWVQNGLTEARAAARIKEILIWRRNNRKDCPKRIVFYKDVFNKKPKPSNNQELVQDMVKKLSRKMKMPR